MPLSHRARGPKSLIYLLIIALLTLAALVGSATSQSRIDVYPKHIRLDKGKTRTVTAVAFGANGSYLPNQTFTFARSGGSASAASIKASPEGSTEGNDSRYSQNLAEIRGLSSGTVEFAASLGGGPLGPYQPAPFIATLTLSGTWTGATRGDDGGSGPVVFQLTQNGTRLGGTIFSPGFSLPPLPLDGTVSGSTFTFAVPFSQGGCSNVTTFTGQVSGSSMSGTYRGSGVCLGAPTTSSGTFSATR